MRLADPSLNASSLLHDSTAFVANLTHTLADVLNVSTTMLQVSLRADAPAANATAPPLASQARVGQMEAIIATTNSGHFNYHALLSKNKIPVEYQNVFHHV
jgi:hypothetical protein